MDQPASADAPAGIHCANPNCRTRAGERSRGHQSCRAQLCGSCCQNEAKAAAEKGEQRPVCKVHARRTHTGHRPAGQTNQHQKDALPVSQHNSSILVLSDRDSGQPSLPGLLSTSNTLSGLQVPGSNQSVSVPNNANTGPKHIKENDLDELLDKRSRLEQSLKRSLTIVVWYKNGHEPLRIAHEVQTFPLFHLQDFPELVSELRLTSSSYIDTYNADTGQWEQHKISTVRSIRYNGQEQENQDQQQHIKNERKDQQQHVKNERNDQRRLLYRIRPSLLESLTDCPGLDVELQYQPLPLQNAPQTTNSGNPIQPQTNGGTSLKRGDPFNPPPQGKHARVLANTTPVRAPSSTNVQTWEAQTPSPSLSNATASASTNNTSPPTWGFAAPSTPVPPPISALPSPSSTRRWPTDYTVHEITAGFAAMNSLMTEDPSLRQKAAFERVFPPCRYVKSTVGRAKLYWKRASEPIKSHFLSIPEGDDRGKWTHFVHLMDGRLVIELNDGNGPGGGSQTGPGTPGQERAAAGSRSGDGPSVSMNDTDAKVDSAGEEDLPPAPTPGPGPGSVLGYSTASSQQQQSQHQPAHTSQPRVNVHPPSMPNSSPALPSPIGHPHPSLSGHQAMMVRGSGLMQTQHVISQNHGHSPLQGHASQHPSLSTQSSHSPHIAGSRPSHVPPTHSGHSHHASHAAHVSHPSHQPHPPSFSHHASSPSMPMSTTFVNDRNMSNNHRSSSSLSGAITIPNS